MPFQFDDYFTIPRAGALLGLEPFAPFDDPTLAAMFQAPSAGDTPKPDNRYYFRPVMWATWWVLLKVCGGFADPTVFHAAMLAIHGAGAVLLLRIVARLSRRTAGVMAGVAFAVLPGGSQATSWASAMGDELAVLWMLLATLQLLRHAESRRNATLIHVGLCIVLAQLAKETALFLVPAALACRVGLDHVRGRPIAWTALVVTTGSMVLALLVRATYVQGIVGTYLGSSIHLDGGVASGLWAAFRTLLVPWNRAPEFASLAPRLATWFGGDSAMKFAGLSTAAAIALVVPTGLAALSKGRRGVVLFVVGACAVIFTLVPLLLLPLTDQNLHGRAYYPATCALSGFIGLTVGGVEARRARRAAIAGLLPFIAISADVALHYARSELDVGDAVRGRLESIEAQVSATPDALVVVIDPEFLRGGVPMISTFMRFAMRPPFRRAPAAVLCRPDLASIDALPELAEFPGPIHVLKADGDRLVPVCRPLPPFTVGGASTRLDRGGRAAVFDAPPPSRAVGGVLLQARCDEGRTEPVVLTWVTETGNKTARIGVDALRASAKQPVTVGAPAGADWPMAVALREVRLDGAAFTSPPTVLASLPTITIVSPVESLPVEDLMHAPIRFRVPEGASELRVIVSASVRPPTGQLMLAYRTAVRFLDRHGDELEFRMASPTPVESVAWSDGRPVNDADMAQLSSGDANVYFVIGVRIEAMGADGLAVVARSPWRFFRATVGRSP